MTQFFSEPKKKDSQVAVVEGGMAALGAMAAIAMANTFPVLSPDQRNLFEEPEYEYNKKNKVYTTIHDLYRMNKAAEKRKKRKARNLSNFYRVI